MHKTAGIILGSALAISLLLMLFGVPQFGHRPATPTLPAPTVDSATPPSSAADLLSPRQQPEIVENDASLDSEAVDPADQELIDTIFEQPTEDIDLADATDTVATEDTPRIGDDVPATAAEQDLWFAFWSPFRSEIAATGFMQELQRTTGLDYRVVKQKIGVYEVAVAYRDDADIADKLATIAMATGLEMPAGPVPGDSPDG